MKQLFIIFLLALATHLSYSQINISAKGGLNYTNVEMSEALTGHREFKFGFHLGMASEFEITEKINITPELIYSLKGFKPEGKNESGAMFNFNYMNLPILVGYDLTKYISVLLGPELGYLFSAKIRVDSNTADLKDFYDSNFDFGIAMGLGFSITEKLSSQFRYVHGINSVTKDAKLTDDGINFTEVKYYNRTLQLSLSYKIN